MIGPGKYDDIVTRVRAETEAEGVILIVIRGNRGEGFSAQMLPDYRWQVPFNLRQIADQIEADLKKEGKS